MLVELPNIQVAIAVDGVQHFAPGFLPFGHGNLPCIRKGTTLRVYLDAHIVICLVGIRTPFQMNVHDDRLERDERKISAFIMYYSLNDWP